MPPIPAMVIRYAATRLCANIIGTGAAAAARGISGITTALEQAGLQRGSSSALSSAMQGAATIGNATSHVFAGLGQVLTGRVAL